MWESDYIRELSPVIFWLFNGAYYLSRGVEEYKKLLDHPPCVWYTTRHVAAADVPVFPSLDGQLQLSLVQRETSIGAADNHLYS